MVDDCRQSSMLQPCDKATTGLPDEHAILMVATHAGTSLGAVDLTHREQHDVTSTVDGPIVYRLQRCYARFTMT
jgi:hypothetical protein